jgi:lipoyl-dependent peroxiredoxin
MTTNQPTPILKPLYTAHATSVGGREGTVKTDDGTLDLSIAMPPGLGGKGDKGTNPEQLFAAGYAACFGSAVGFVARQKKLTTGPITIQADVTIGAIASGGFGLAVKLGVTLPELAQAEAEALVAAAHQVCPYSNATRGNIEVKLEVKGQ